MKQLMLLMAIFLMVACSANKETADTNQQPERTERRGGKGGQQPPSVDEIIAQMDANKDGKLAKSEVKGRLLEDFAKIDTNEDGFLSKAELEKAPKPQKGGNGQRPPRQ